MKHILGVILVAAVASAAFGYSGATVTAIENDNATAGATVFAVPAAAGMAGAQLLYNNSTELSFSPNTGPSYLTFPLSSPGVTVHVLSAYRDGSAPQVTGINPYDDTIGPYYTNTQGVATDPRFPAGIPRPAMDSWSGYSAFQFDLANAANKFGVFVAMNTNQGLAEGKAWPPSDDNNVQFPNYRPLNIAIFGENDTTPQILVISVADMYAPFIKVTGNGTDKIKSVCIIQNGDDQNITGAPFGFFDVYAVPAVQPLTGDINNDGYVNASDLQMLVATWGRGPGYSGPEDINKDGYVNVGDLQLLIANWGAHR